MKKTIVAILFSAALVFAPQAFAEGYFGVGIGQSNVDIDTTSSTPGVTVTADDTSIAYKIFGGDKVTEYFGWELGWIDLGDFNIYATDGIDYLSQDAEGAAFYAAAIGYMPVSEDVTFFGKIGFARWDVDFSYDSSLGFIPNESDSGTDLMFGVGGQFSAFRVEYERYTDVGDPDGEDIDVFTAAYILTF